MRKDAQTGWLGTIRFSAASLGTAGFGLAALLWLVATPDLIGAG